MARPPGSSRFDAVRLGLDSTGEIRIGAYARRQRRRRLLVGALGVSLIAAAVWMYFELRPDVSPDNPERYPVVLRCGDCGEVSETDVRFGQTFPAKCSKCGEVACRPLWQCRDCGARFVPDQTGAAIHCPECNSLAVGSAAGP